MHDLVYHCYAVVGYREALRGLHEFGKSLLQVVFPDFQQQREQEKGGEVTLALSEVRFPIRSTAGRGPTNVWKLQLAKWLKTRLGGVGFRPF